MTAFFYALAFLTRIPVPSSVHTRPNALHHAAAWFPVIGFLLGCIYAATAWFGTRFLNPAIMAILVTGCDAVLTGALHLDGLADMADGFGGGRTREDVLRIMRDHAIGSYGAIALILIILFKTFCLAAVFERPAGIWVLMTAPALSRWAILLLARLAPYARADTSEGTAGTGALSRSIRASDLVIGTALCLPLIALAGAAPVCTYWLVTTAVTVGIASLSRRRIGGITGDVLGANTVLAEAAQFLTAVLLHHG
jgi:adenosylcobinamide-GDP ribazoletransferase